MMTVPHFSFQSTVLVIDELSKSEALIRNGLLSYPANFEFCSSEFPEVMGSLSKSKPDLLVVSLEFQKGSVLDFAEKTRKEWANIPSIYVTEPHLLDMQKAVIRMGAFDIIPRPTLDTSELIRKIDRAVRVTRKLKTRAESFIELHEESRVKGIAVATLLDEKTEYSSA